MYARGNGGENSRTQRAALIGRDNLQRTVQHVAAGLHDHRVWAIPPSAMTLLTSMPCSVKHSIIARAPKAVAAIRPPNRAGASVARLRSVITPLRRWLANGVPAAVEPVEHHRQVFKRRIFRPCGGELGQQLFLTFGNLGFSSGCVVASWSSGQPSTRPNCA